jgi:phytanoyl-CoA hydroxylase
MWEGTATPEERKSHALLDIHEPQQYSALFTEFLTDPRILDRVEDLFGSGNLQEQDGKGFIKPPAKGGFFLPHTDHGHFPHKDGRSAAVTIYLTEADTENGCIVVWPGTHTADPPHRPSNGYKHLRDEDWPRENAVPVVARPGDVSIHALHTVHASGPNNSPDRVRVNYIRQINVSENTFVDPTFRGGQFAEGIQLRGRKMPRQVNKGN